MEPCHFLSISEVLSRQVTRPTTYNKLPRRGAQLASMVHPHPPRLPFTYIPLDSEKTTSYYIMHRTWLGLLHPRLIIHQLSVHFFSLRSGQRLRLEEGNVGAIVLEEHIEVEYELHNGDLLEW